MSIEGGTVIFRQWKEDTGLEEVTQSFNTLEELYNFCINTHDPLLVDRVHIDGDDEDGKPRRLTLVFQSITISEK